MWRPDYPRAPPGQVNAREPEGLVSTTISSILVLVSFPPNLLEILASLTLSPDHKSRPFNVLAFTGRGRGGATRYTAFLVYPAIKDGGDPNKTELWSPWLDSISLQRTFQWFYPKRKSHLKLRRLPRKAYYPVKKTQSWRTRKGYFVSRVRRLTSSVSVSTALHDYRWVHGSWAWPHT